MKKTYCIGCGTDVAVPCQTVGEAQKCKMNNPPKVILSSKINN